MADTPSAPPLPDGSVDFNAIHAAARQGHDLDKAATAATHVHPDKEAAEKASAALAKAASPRTKSPARKKRPAKVATASAKPVVEQKATGEAVKYLDGTPVEQLKPAEPSTTNEKEA